jgi:predicted nucleic acid-binding protein
MFNCAVVNAGPLVELSLLDQLDLLPALYAECWVPQTVFNEVAVAGLGKPGAKSLQSSDWLARVRVSPIPDPLLVMELDAGEAEVISLARQLSPSTAVIDERRGRRIAQQVYGLTVKGTAGILVEAKRRGLISGVRPNLLALRAEGYFIAESVIVAACLAAGE